jgi:predicted phage terminase large subunit-like protein
VLTKKDQFNFYITTDFATSEKESADYSVISVWAYNNNGDWMYVDGTVGRQLMDTNVDDLFRFVTQYRPLSVGIEISGQQAGFVSWIKAEMLNRNIYFNLAKDVGSSKEGLRPTTNKMTRFLSVLPLFKAKKIWFPKELRESKNVVEAMEELRNAAMAGFRSKHDDFIDTVSMLGLLQPYKPSMPDTLKFNKTTQIWEDFDDEEGADVNSYMF